MRPFETLSCPLWRHCNVCSNRGRRVGHPMFSLLAAGSCSHSDYTECFSPASGIIIPSEYNSVTIARNAIIKDQKKNFTRKRNDIERWLPHHLDVVYGAALRSVNPLKSETTKWSTSLNPLAPRRCECNYETHFRNSILEQLISIATWRHYNESAYKKIISRKCISKTFRRV